jgi:ABC-type dipeptide/oligopeptide/nickel transport system ATPase component
MSTRDVFTQQEASELLTKNEDELRHILELRVNAVQQDPSLSLQPSIEVRETPFESIELPPWIQNVVDSMIATALRQAHKVLCSTAEEFKELRANLIGALGVGGSAAVIAMAAFLTGTLGMAAALGTVIATIVIKKIGEPALRSGKEALCTELKKMLPD